MKKKIIPILSGILALTMLSGCGAPQAQTEPTTVNQAMLIEKSSHSQTTASRSVLPATGPVRKEN